MTWSYVSLGFMSISILGLMLVAFVAAIKRENSNQIDDFYWFALRIIDILVSVFLIIVVRRINKIKENNRQRRASDYSD